MFLVKYIGAVSNIAEVSLPIPATFHRSYLYRLVLRLLTLHPFSSSSCQKKFGVPPSFLRVKYIMSAQGESPDYLFSVGP